MVIIGNPPYSGESNNKGLFEEEIKEYKQEPEGGRLNERNSKWLNDDYVKFMRFAEMTINKNKEGIMAFITNHAYIDNPTFRGMRWHLCESFDKIYILDLHGNSSQRETASDGSKDENIFKIKQGVAIFIGVKNSASNKKLANVFHADILGTRKHKFTTLGETKFAKTKWEVINLKKPHYIFLNNDPVIESEYDKGIPLNEIFIKSSIGIQTHANDIVVAYSKDELKKQILDYQKERSQNLYFDEEKVKPVTFRPFDTRFYYEDSSIVERPRLSLSKEMDKNNLALCFMKQYAYNVPYSYSLITNCRIIDRTFISNKGAAYFAPLFLHFEDGSKNPNISEDVLKKLTKKEIP
jgi:predicted helicase